MPKEVRATHLTIDGVLYGCSFAHDISERKRIQAALDNIEGLTFGPVVNGKRTLILVSDNNFNPAQFTQFVALTIE